MINKILKYYSSINTNNLFEHIQLFDALHVKTYKQLTGVRPPDASNKTIYEKYFFGDYFSVGFWQKLRERIKLSWKKFLKNLLSSPNNCRSSHAYTGSTKYLFFFGKCFKKTTECYLKFFYLKLQSFRLIVENNFIQLVSISQWHKALTTNDYGFL